VGALLLAIVLASLWATGWVALRADRRWGLNLFHGYDEVPLVTFLGLQVYCAVFAVCISLYGLIGVLLPAFGRLILHGTLR
jgi:hypothetical protein